MDSRVQQGGHGAIRACADDVGAALSNISLLIPLKQIFDLARDVAGLALKPSKCILVPLYSLASSHVVCVIRDWLARNIPDWYEFKVVSCAKYLGVWLGPLADSKQWRSQASKCIARATDIVALGAPPAVAAELYNTRAVTTLSYIAQFAPPADWFATKGEMGLVSFAQDPP